jgi:hypothetical protein
MPPSSPSSYTKLLGWARCGGQISIIDFLWRLSMTTGCNICVIAHLHEWVAPFQVWFCINRCHWWYRSVARVWGVIWHQLVIQWSMHQTLIMQWHKITVLCLTSAYFVLILEADQCELQTQRKTTHPQVGCPPRVSFHCQALEQTELVYHHDCKHLWLDLFKRAKTPV